MQTPNLRDTVIARRTLSLRDASGDVQDLAVIVYAPYRYRREWRCRFTIIHQDNPRTTAAIGEDALQALVLALDAISQALAKDFPHAQWLGLEPGNHGLPFMVHQGFFPTAWFQKVRAQTSRRIENEARRFVQEKRG